MDQPRQWTSCTLGCLLLLLFAQTAAYSQDAEARNGQSGSRPPSAVVRNPGQAGAVSVQKIPALPPAIQIGSEKVASLTTVDGWQNAIGAVSVVLPRDGACLVICNLDVQSHVMKGTLIFRTARHNVAEGTNETDDTWAMDVPVPIAQGSASTSYAWTMKGGQVYRFGCRMRPTGQFIGIPVYPNVSWICR